MLDVNLCEGASSTLSVSDGFEISKDLINCEETLLIINQPVGESLLVDMPNTVEKNEGVRIVAAGNSVFLKAAPSLVEIVREVPHRRVLSAINVKEFVREVGDADAGELGDDVLNLLDSLTRGIRILIPASILKLGADGLERSFEHEVEERLTLAEFLLCGLILWFRRVFFAIDPVTKIVIGSEVLNT